MKFRPPSAKAESDAGRFLVLELVDGETLEERLKHGALPVDEALRLSLQIAGALEAAHEKGIIHRDLKTAGDAATSPITLLQNWNPPSK